MRRLCRDWEPHQIEAFQGFTYPLYRRLLRSAGQDEHVVAIGALRHDAPIGLALAEVVPHPQTGPIGEVLSLSVDARHRRQGVALDLLAQLEDELAARCCRLAHGVYITGQPGTPAVERLLQKRGWTPPQARMLVCKSDPRILRAPWWSAAALPDGAEIFPWIQLTPEERRELLRQQREEPWIPADLVPFRFEQDLCVSCSLGLRYQRQVIGWMLTHQLGPETLRITCSFVRPGFQGGATLALQRRIVELMFKTPMRRVSWTVPLFHTAMVQFVRSHVAPYLTSLEESQESCKPLGPAAAASHKDKVEHEPASG